MFRDRTEAILDWRGPERGLGHLLTLLCIFTSWDCNATGTRTAVSEKQNKY